MSSVPIRVLPETLIGRIAAGEVVERPMSVVKELVENSLDAGARRVSVVVEGGLAGLIRIADDGGGIPLADLALAVQRHATSKISTPGDLEGIETLGFRGEGLAAVGAVSRLILTSRTPESEEGGTIFIEGGRIGSPNPAARAPGTTVEVRDLFFNTPVRRKYLKSPAAELRQVSQLLQAYALSRPDVHISLQVDGRLALDLPALDDLHGRVGQVLGRERRDRMVAVLAEGPGFQLEGFLGAPEDSRVRAAHQILLVNDRWVTSQLLRTALRQAYGDLIPPSRHPEAVLHLRVPAGEVDVNVHPTKREVRLLRERELYPRLIRALGERVEQRFPSLRLRDPEPAPVPEGKDQGSLALYARRPASPVGGGLHVSERASRPGSAIVSFPGTDELPPSRSEEEPGLAMASMWQLHETYILAAIEGGLLLIDQHAAHERVLFEQAMDRFRGVAAPSQELLFPLVVEFSHDEFSTLLEVQQTLEKLGFHLELLEGTTVLVHAIPSGLREWRHGALLRDVLDHFTDLPTKLDVHERVARSVACQGAVKAGQKLSLSEMNALIDQLFATDKPQGDPHGRPVFLRVGLDELHRRFGRSG
jgi:DNA mismatch repair protein MutL